MGTKTKKKNGSQSARVKKGWETRKRNKIIAERQERRAAGLAANQATREGGLKAGATDAKEWVATKAEPLTATQASVVAAARAMSGEAGQGDNPNRPAEVTHIVPPVLAKADRMLERVLRYADRNDRAATLERMIRDERRSATVDSELRSFQQNQRTLLQDFLGDLQAVNNFKDSKHTPLMVTWSTAQALGNFLNTHGIYLSSGNAVEVPDQIQGMDEANTRG